MNGHTPHGPRLERLRFLVKQREQGFYVDVLQPPIDTHCQCGFPHNCCQCAFAKFKTFKELSMLTLKRHHGQAIVYDVPPSDKPTRIIVRVTHANGGEAKLRSDAPDAVKILREELAQPEPLKPPKQLTAADWFAAENRDAWMLNIG